MALSIKHAEIAIENFNNQVQKQIKQLKDHKLNIKKFLHKNEYEGVKREEVGAIRTVKNIKNTILEIQELRARFTKPEDLELFDQRIACKKDEALREVKSFLDMELRPKTTPINTNPDQIADLDDDSIPPIQMCLDELDENQLKARTKLLHDMENIENELAGLFEVFKKVHDMVHEQAEPVERVSENVADTQISVEQGTSHLRTALKYQKAAYPLMGAVIGTCIAGPLGLIAGMKTGASLMAAGGLASVTGGFLGFSGGKILKKEAIAEGTIPESTTQH
ncbi:syntaxin-17 [Culicoides brevitarsis]|uniref:syntaxin-17 n=1 Tax=Culicoides brevitarsis TaxID=469753 RepID=UPI00307B3782